MKKENFELNKSDKKMIEERLDAYQKLFELGQRSLLNLVDTERELFNARSDLINNQFLVLSSAYRVLATMGVLTKKI